MSAIQLLNKISKEILQPFVGFLMALAIMLFVFGIVEYMLGAANEDKREEGKRHMIWGIVGLFIMVSVWGIMRILLSFWK